MNKKKTANLIMVLLILAIAIGGVVTAVLLKAHSDTGLGSQYKITAIPGNALTESGQDTCTVTIVCDTVLDNRDSLNEEKAPFVPTDGVILPKTTVSFAQGDTVYQVLQKVTQAADIQMESSWTPMYDSYYVEGINHLYEFDCGPESGWMYKVNEWFPNYGCSAYTLKPGDDIVWCYTCAGLGADVGETWMGD